jgi:ubiquinone/menaquinone biosynthesis C-methylase UbiE
VLTQDPPHQWGTLVDLQTLEDEGVLAQVQRILDVGCGDGWTVGQFRARGKEAVGITICADDLRGAETDWHQRLLVADMHDLPFADHTFDLTYLRHVLEHAIAPFIVLCEMNRVLREGGFLFIAMPPFESDEWMFAPHHYSLLHKRQVRNLLNKTQFLLQRSWEPPGEQCYLAVKGADLP